MSTNTQKLAAGGTPSLDDLTQIVIALITAGTQPDDIRAAVDGAIDQAGADAADDNADPNAPPAEQTAASYRIIHNGELLSVRLNRRQMATCKNNNIDPAQYARAVAKHFASSKDSGSWGIRRLPVGGAQ